MLMKYYLSEILPRLKKFSAGLDQTALLIDKPWVVSDNTQEYQKLIFRSDGRVHLSLNGTIKDGKWEYLPEAQSLIIDYDGVKKLYRHQYLDEAVLALKIDGKKNSNNKDFYLLGNENAIPDLDVKLYLRNKFLKEENINVVTLKNGTEIELHGKRSEYPKAKVNGKLLSNGTYKIKDDIKLIIENGHVIDRVHKVRFSSDMSIWMSGNFPEVGDEVEGLLNGKFTGSKYKITVENGRIVGLKDLEMRMVGIIVLIVVSILLFAVFFN